MQITGGRAGVIIKANETEKRALNLTKITTSFIARNLETGGDEADKALHDAAARACEAVGLVEQLLAKRNEVAPAAPAAPPVANDDSGAINAAAEAGAAAMTGGKGKK